MKSNLVYAGKYTLNRQSFSESELMAGLQNVGLTKGDTVFLHIDLEHLGDFEGCVNSQEKCKSLLRVLQEIVGPEGTLLVPTYTFSFCRQEIFDVQKSPTHGGPWSRSVDFLEYFRNLAGVIRSEDPIHSVAGMGPRAAELLLNIPQTCFGRDCVHERLKAIGGKICTIGVGLDEATFRHHAEESVGVPFRFKKLFTGYIRNNSQLRKTGWIYNVRIMAENGYPDGSRLERYARDKEACLAARVGSGEILAIESRTYFQLTVDALAKDPWFTAKGPAGNTVVLENHRVGVPQYEVNVPADASIEELIDGLWSLPRDLVSDGYDAALTALATQVPMTIHEYPSGTECWGWIVPEKWTCHEAYLETLDGKRLFSSADNPLHVVSYSLPFEGVISREELLKRLHVHGKIPEAIPFVFHYYERDWGLCCSKLVKDSLSDDQYRVVIKTSFGYGTLKVGEVVAKGQSDECIILCVHLCHPHQAVDDLSGVIVGIKVMSELLKRCFLKYTYRLLIVPETIGSLAYLSQNEPLIPKMKGGLYLEMLGLNYPHALQLSFAANTELDICFTQALKEQDFHSWTGPYRSVIGNDERQFNGPGVRVPMLSLSRVLPESSPDWPYREYHSSYDNPDLVSTPHLHDSVKAVLKMIDAIECNHIPVNNFKGEAFCSRYGVFIDPYTNPKGSKQLFRIMDHIDGTRSVAQIAEVCGVPFTSAQNIIEELKRHGLVDYKS